MRISVSPSTLLNIPKLEAFDLDPVYGLAVLTLNGDEIAVYLNGKLLSAWRHGKDWKAFQVKWIEANSVAIAAACSILIVSAAGREELEPSWPYTFATSHNYIFIGYGEEAVNGTPPWEPESNGASIYSRRGTREISFRYLFERDRNANFTEVEACYSFDDTFVFVADDSDKVWLVNASDHTYRSITTPFSLVSIHVMSGDDKTAYAIFDNRIHIRHGAEKPPFELAVFDLVAETAVKSSFAPVEAALIAAGFELGEITLQPNARGRIIVSDAKKAALLEFCDGD
jgi:hypothetical protein